MDPIITSERRDQIGQQEQGQGHRPSVASDVTKIEVKSKGKKIKVNSERSRSRIKAEARYT